MTNNNKLVIICSQLRGDLMDKETDKLIKEAKIQIELLKEEIKEKELELSVLLEKLKEEEK